MGAVLWPFVAALIVVAIVVWALELHLRKLDKAMHKKMREDARSAALDAVQAAAESVAKAAQRRKSTKN